MNYHKRRVIAASVLLSFFSSLISPAFAEEAASKNEAFTSSFYRAAGQTAPQKPKKFSSKKSTNKSRAQINSKLASTYKPYLEVGGAKYFNQATNVSGIYDLFIPLLQQEDQLLFTDIRIFDRSGSAVEGNFHLGYRKLLDPSQMFGIYGAFDYKKSDKQNSFHQLTLGLEYWHHTWFVGANAYKPIGITKKYVGETTFLQEVPSSRSIAKIITTNKLYEEALPGVDAELGYALTEDLTSYVGGYYFAASGAETVTGPKIRVTYDYLQPVGRILGVVDGISIEAGAQHDKPRGYTAYIGLKFKVGLTSLTKNSNVSGFKRHMVELVKRDPDIVVGQSQETHQQKQYYQEGKYSQDGEHGFVGGDPSPTRPYSERTDYENWPKAVLLQELGLPADATHNEVRKAYYKLSVVHHPDKARGDNTSQARFNGIYTELKNRFYAEISKQLHTSTSDGVVLNLPATQSGGLEYYGGGKAEVAKNFERSHKVSELGYKYSNVDVEKLLAYRLLEARNTVIQFPKVTVITPVSQAEFTARYNAQPEMFNSWLSQEVTDEQKQVILPILDHEEHWVSAIFAKPMNSTEDYDLVVKYLDSLDEQGSSRNWLVQLFKKSYPGKVDFVEDQVLQQAEESVGCGAYAIENTLLGLNLPIDVRLRKNFNEQELRSFHHDLLVRYNEQEIPRQELVSFVDLSAILPVGVSVVGNRTIRGGRRVRDRDEVEFEDEGNVFKQTIRGRKLLGVMGTPVLVGSLDTGSPDETSRANEIVVDGDYAYIADWYDGLKVINIATPSSPSLVGSLDTNNAMGIDKVGNYVYIADGSEGLKIIDVSTPSSPFLVGSLGSLAAAEAVSVVGNYAYMATSSGGSGLKIVDVSTPSSPSLIGSLETPHAQGVAVSGNYAYIADDYEPTGLKIIDVSTPSSPSLTGSLNTDGESFGVTVVGNYAYLGDGTAGLKIIDISTPSSPSLVGSLDTTNAHDLVVIGDHVYMADSTGGLRIIDVSTPSSPSLTSSWSETTVNDVTVVGNYAYVAAQTAGLKIFRVKNEAPTVSTVAKAGTEGSTTTFSSSDFTAKFSDSDGDSLTKIRVTSLPSNGTLKLSGSDVAVNQEINSGDLGNLTFDPETNWSGNSSFTWKGYDGYDYSASAANVNIVKTLSPVLVGSLDTHAALGIAVAGNYAYVADYSAGLRIIDFSNKTDLPSNKLEKH